MFKNYHSYINRSFKLAATVNRNSKHYIQNGHGRPWFQAELSLKTTTAYSEFSNS
ncbi:hypothetical protein TPHV1_70056 [Treponema phagedenis]|uniref:Uncharacterized protein n=1 Tax=Treponema phagedenis TaxID=162 RepID=A0A0B7GXE9_TREPH|nr:hypothetical protein TPHV1_70056 [Treponema phagedenis]